MQEFLKAKGRDLRLTLQPPPERISLISATDEQVDMHELAVLTTFQTYAAPLFKQEYGLKLDLWTGYQYSDILSYELVINPLIQRSALDLARTLEKLKTDLSNIEIQKLMKKNLKPYEQDMQNLLEKLNNGLMNSIHSL